MENGCFHRNYWSATTVNTEKFEYDNFFNHINLNIPEQWMLEIVSFKAKKIAKMCPTGIIIEVSK